MGLLEKLLPDTIPLTEEQFQTFLEQTVLTEHSRRILDGLTAQNAATAPEQGTDGERGARVTGLRSDVNEGLVDYTSTSGNLLLCML